MHIHIIYINLFGVLKIYILFNLENKNKSIMFSNFILPLISKKDSLTDILRTVV